MEQKNFHIVNISQNSELNATEIQQSIIDMFDVRVYYG